MDIKIYSKPPSNKKLELNKFKLKNFQDRTEEFYVRMLRYLGI